MGLIWFWINSTKVFYAFSKTYLSHDSELLGHVSQHVFSFLSRMQVKSILNLGPFEFMHAHCTIFETDDSLYANSKLGTPDTALGGKPISNFLELRQNKKFLYLSLYLNLKLLKKRPVSARILVLYRVTISSIRVRMQYHTLLVHGCGAHKGAYKRDKKATLLLPASRLYN